MNKASSLHYFSYRSAFVFFFFLFLMNVCGHPLLVGMGLSENLSLFVVNSLAVSIGMTGVLRLLEGRLRERKALVGVFALLLVVSGITCFAILFM
ncbi:hypothetical protein A374_05386 [Fictibacillus macauensis ZFHKF-1]|uniref:Uncharacterized protein n=1 Tax=Fictibacillus macauensis ZFHKF-1 TaxID=1196324 RepID=I8J3M0_9BACL|nr:hypothetical protein [Fictibacillus macauensis]EIT86371.1 hypothetical protein A374_05386 [Fictibacillus macauensis ZFHKF-1]